MNKRTILATGLSALIGMSGYNSKPSYAGTHQSKTETSSDSPSNRAYVLTGSDTIKLLFEQMAFEAAADQYQTRIKNAKSEGRDTTALQFQYETRKRAAQDIGEILNGAREIVPDDSLTHE